MIYLDNGATSFPKPRQVTDAVMNCMEKYCANPGRSGHTMALRTGNGIFHTRMAVGKLFNIDEQERIIFTKNCTEALNMAIRGILRGGDHVITSSLEHNSVMRPLEYMKGLGVEVTVVRCSEEGYLDVEDIEKAVRPETRMIILTAASNVVGTKMPLEEVGALALHYGILFMVDGAQAAGHTPIDVQRLNIDLLAAPGHKGLLGPEGTGFLYVGSTGKMLPLLMGGTSTKSKELEQPLDYPEGYESGTLNAPGIIGLGEAIKYIDTVGIEAIEAYERLLTNRLYEGLASIPDVILYGPRNPEDKLSVLSMNIREHDCEEVAMLLSDRYGIATRAGFHCCGTGHDTIGTGAIGTVRLCPGIFNIRDDIDKTIDAIKEISRPRPI